MLPHQLYKHYYFTLLGSIIRHLSSVNSPYSVLKLFTGFASAALMAWKLMVAKAITADSTAAAKNTHHAILI